jgi:hypothetical protein
MMNFATSVRQQNGNKGEGNHNWQSISAVGWLFIG